MMYKQYLKEKKMIRLVLTGICQIAISSSVYANFELADFDKETYQRHYNSLPFVEENNAVLTNAPQFIPFLKKAEEIIERYELESSVGLRLIHRHFNLDKGQVISEGYEVIDKVPSLVTSSHIFEEAIEQGALPASWIFYTYSQQEPLLFEASNDPAVKMGNSQLQKSPEFFDEIGKLLREEQLDNLLSIAILKRNSLVAGEEQVYMETSSGEQNTSVIQLWNASNSPQNTIRTSWSFRGPKQQTCWYEYRCLGIDGRHVSVTIGHHN